MADKTKATNITWHEHTITMAERAERNGHQAAVLWFTGLSAAGKSTLAQAVQQALFERACQTYVLDGDNVRHNLNKNLGFSPEDREENIRRIGEVASLFSEAGFIAMTAFISPYRSDRDGARQVCKSKFIEVYVQCDMETCAERDPKGLYKKALAGEIADFTGVSAPYEEPEQPEIVVHTAKQSLQECVNTVVRYLAEQRIVNL